MTDPRANQSLTRNVSDPNQFGLSPEASLALTSAGNYLGTNADLAANTKAAGRFFSLPVSLVAGGVDIADAYKHGTRYDVAIQTGGAFG